MGMFTIQVENERTKRLRTLLSRGEKGRPEIRPRSQVKDTAAPVNHFNRPLIHTNCVSLSRYRIKEHIFPEIHVIPQRRPLV